MDLGLLSTVVWLGTGGGLALLLGAFGWTSLREREKRPARLSFALAGVAAGAGVWAALLPEGLRLALLGGFLMAALAFLVLFLRPGKPVDLSRDVPLGRFDERDIAFARQRLVPGSPPYETYYRMRPENKASDDEIRSLAGLLSPRAALADPLLFAAAQGGFFLTEALRGAVDGTTSGRGHDLGPDRMTAYIKNLARYFGAREVGVAVLRPYHVYSRVGRGEGLYGEEVAFEPASAVAFTVEMDFAMTAAAPNPPEVVETARQYVEAARVAVPLAAVLRNLGFPSRAHIDGNYRVIAPLVARDAGLGEIGRMGILMTPRLGPRVRLGVVTTALELKPDPPTRDAAVIDFCSGCEKCVRACPAGAIPSGGRREEGGALRWRIDSAACFRYWNTAGTDCARCMAVCPFSHPEGVFHDLVRSGVRRSAFFRRAAAKLDDLFYGRKPPPHEPPAWTKP